ncbi:MAG TPA: TonB-dependent receptor, partial [Bacteroidia bacterium]|nr:TonB-dependent receptor [Bacteroidia bacterium]
GESFLDYQLEEPVVGTDTITETDLVRRKWLDNDFYGVTWTLNYAPFNYFNVILGGAWNQYDGDHFGEVIWAQYASNGNIRHRYYDNNGLKTDFNIFLKSTISLTEKLSLMGDVQYRKVGYNFTGIDDQLQPIPQSDVLNFFNPKAGITYTVKPGTYGYLSFSVGNKEPSRDDYTESSLSSRPKPERLYDFESGYFFQNNKFMAGFNYYIMLYDNQLVLTGQINDVGNYTRTNIKKSYREGVELEAGWNPIKILSVKGNVTISRSEISEFRQYTDDYDNGGQILQIFRNTDIAFSPQLTGFLNLSVRPVKQLECSLISRYVGEQYLDNTSDKSKTIDPWFTQDFRVNWTIKTKSIDAIILTGSVNNFLDEAYESNGYTFSYISGGAKNDENYFYPQAGRNFNVQLTLKF